MMKTIASATIAVIACFLFSCSKGRIQTVSGTIDGKPAITLYGNSNKAADYIFLSADSSVKEMTYNGILLTYTSATPPGIFLLKASVAIGRGSLTTVGAHTTLTIDTTYGFTFGSKQYASK